MSHKNDSWCLFRLISGSRGLVALSRQFIRTAAMVPGGSGIPTELIEQGPFASRALAEEACKSFSSQVEKPALKGGSWWTLIGLLAALIYWLLSALSRGSSEIVTRIIDRRGPTLLR